MNIFWGIIGVIIAYLLVRFRRQIIDFTGYWGWAEKYLGAGKSETACVLIGIITFFISITMMFGLLDDIIGGIISPFVNQEMR